MYEQIFKNIPGNAEWEGTFYEKLTEYGIWDADEFWKLHLELIEVAKKDSQLPIISRELALAVATLYSKIFILITAHYDKNDIFNIRNLTSNELINFTERFQHAMVAVFSGQVTPESSYDLNNPLISNLNMKQAHEKIALAFGQYLINGEFALAHALLNPALAKQLDLASLQSTYENMVRNFAPAANHAEVIQTMSDWPDKLPSDVAWAYVSIDNSSSHAEAVSLTLENGQNNGKNVMQIRLIEWGRP